jgi:glycosyltransferase involved in cell wall biosynthesis
MGFSRYFSVLDRDGTFPEIPGVNRIPFPRWEAAESAFDSIRLESKCVETASKVFISTLNTFPVETRSVALLHDFIPEKMGVAVESASIIEKRFAIYHASRFVCVSESTRRDLLHYYQIIKNDLASVAMLGVAPGINKVDEFDVENFKDKYKITHPFFLLVGERVGLLGEAPPARGYKNAELFFRVANNWSKIHQYDVVLIGGSSQLEPELVQLAPNLTPILIKATEDELAAAYSGALALVYPSYYEGFGLPVLEAMKCGCPVITSDRASLPEVGGGAPIYIDPENGESLLQALEKIVKGDLVPQMKSAGRERAESFSWDTIAKTLWEALTASPSEALVHSSLWRKFREAQAKEKLVENKISDLENKIEQLNDTEKSLRSSLSWRITAPLRQVDNIMRACLKR